MPHRRWTARVAVLAALVVVAGSAASGSAAAPAPLSVHPRPADGVFDLLGHGWGHGRGMSQHGALGMAKAGRDATTIGNAYYPGTTVAKVADSTLRVVLLGDEGRDTQVFAHTGLRFREVSTGVGGDLPPGYSRYRIRTGTKDLALEGLKGNTWQPVYFAGRRVFKSPVRFGGPPGVRLVLPGGGSREYRGTTYAVQAPGNGLLQSIQHLTMEQYLPGVVPRESPSSWPAAALRAQAVAARTYALYLKGRAPAGRAWDTCDTTACQVFGGTRLYDAAGRMTPLEPASTTLAVQQSAGVIRTYGGKPILAEFSSSNGGWSVQTSLPYMVARADPYDAQGAPGSNGVNSWQAQLPVSVLEARWPAIGRLSELRVLQRDGRGEWGGRVQKVELVGSAGRITVTGDEIYRSRIWPAVPTGMRHAWFAIRGNS